MTATLIAPAVAMVSAHRVGVQSIKTLVIGVLLVVGFRVLGKREAAQLNVYDLVMLMALANAVQNAMTAGLGDLRVGLASAGTLLVAAWALTRVVVRRPALESRLVGAPVLLVYNGRVLQVRMRRNLVASSELDEACRQHGVASPADCALAVLEVDGSISVIPADAVAHPSADPAGTAPPAGLRRRLRRPTRREHRRGH